MQLRIKTPNREELAVGLFAADEAKSIHVLLTENPSSRDLAKSSDLFKSDLCFGPLGTQFGNNFELLVFRYFAVAGEGRHTRSCPR